MVRHGETEANKNDIDAGPLDYKLDKRGIKQVSHIARELSRCKVSAIYSSPVFRAVETAKILARSHDLVVHKLEDLTEAKLKPEFVGKPGRHQILTSPSAYTETYTELQRRMLRAIGAVKKREESGAIIVSHGDPIAALLHHVVEREVTDRPSHYVLHPDLGSLSIINLKEPPTLLLFNYHRKLLSDY